MTPSWQGDSVGHYEGDTLVVDTVGIKTGPFSSVDRYGTPFSEKLHVVERYRLIDGEAAAAAVRKHARTFNANAAPVRFDGYGAEVDLDTTKRACRSKLPSMIRAPSPCPGRGSSPISPRPYGRKWFALKTFASPQDRKGSCPLPTSRIFDLG